MRYIAYTRSATSDTDDQVNSIRTYCAEHEHELVGVYEDREASGLTLDRPGLQQALSALERGEADGLVVVSVDRLTRDHRAMCGLLERFLARGGPSLRVTTYDLAAGS